MQDEWQGLHESARQPTASNTRIAGDLLGFHARADLLSCGSAAGSQTGPDGALREAAGWITPLACTRKAAMLSRSSLAVVSACGLSHRTRTIRGLRVPKQTSGGERKDRILSGQKLPTGAILSDLPVKTSDDSLNRRPSALLGSGPGAASLAAAGARPDRTAVRPGRSGAAAGPGGHRADGPCPERVLREGQRADVRACAKPRMDCCGRSVASSRVR